MVNITHTNEEAATPLPSWVDASEHLAAAQALHRADAHSIYFWDSLPDDEQMEYHVRVVRALDPDYKAPVAAGTLSTDKDPRLATDEPLVVTCTVDIPLSSPHATADALSRVPADARLTGAIIEYATESTMSGPIANDKLIVTWEEER